MIRFAHDHQAGSARDRGLHATTTRLREHLGVFPAESKQLARENDCVASERLSKLPSNQQPLQQVVIRRRESHGLFPFRFHLPLSDTRSFNEIASFAVSSKQVAAVTRFGFADQAAFSPLAGTTAAKFERRLQCR